MQVPTGFVAPLSRWIMRRFGPAPVAASFIHHDLYETSAISLALVPDGVEVAENRKLFDHLVENGTAGFVVPTALVVTVSNTDASGTRPIYLTDLMLHVMDRAPLAMCLLGKRGLLLRSIQAGGRGSDGGFGVQFRAERRRLSLLKSAIAAGYDGPTRMRIDPGRFAEVGIGPWPEQSGRYRLGMSISVTDGRRSWLLRLPETINVYRLGEDPIGVPCTETHEFSHSKAISANEFAAANAEKTELAPLPDQLPAHLASRVFGGIRAEAG